MMELLSETPIPIRLAAASLGLLGVYLLAQIFNRKRLHLPPGPLALPLVGNFFSMAFSGLQPDELTTKWAREYGDVYMFSLFGVRFVMLGNYEVARDAYVNHDVNSRCPLNSCNKALGRPNTSNGLIFCDDSADWLEMRKCMMTGLRKSDTGTSTKSEQMVTEQTSKFLDFVSNLKGAPFYPLDSIYVTVANSVSSFLFGRTYDYDDEEFLQLINVTRQSFEAVATGALNYHIPFLAALPLEANRRQDKSMAKMFDFIRKMVKQQKEAFDPSQDKNCFKSVIHSFLREQHARKEKVDPRPYDDDHLFQMIFDVIAAGFETVSTTLTWYVYTIAKHPDVQAKVQAELDEVIGRRHLPTLSDKNKLPYTLAAMSECNRISIIAPNLIPHRAGRDVTIKGFTIPKGTYVNVNGGWIMSDPKIWGDPENFRPERFLKEKDGTFNAAAEAKMAVFGLGRRACAGEQLARTELFLIFTHFLHRFSLRLPEGSPKTIGRIPGLTYQPTRYEITATRRE